MANLFLGRELLTPWRTLDDHRMDADARKVFLRLNKNFSNVRTPVRRLSGGQRQVVAISRAIYFNARILIMDEPTAALGPEETAMVGALVRELKAQGVGIFLITHDMPDVFGLSDRLAAMKNGRLVGTYRTTEVTEDEVLGMIIAGKQPEGKAQDHEDHGRPATRQAHQPQRAAATGARTPRPVARATGQPQWTDQIHRQPAGARTGRAGLAR